MSDAVNPGGPSTGGGGAAEGGGGVVGGTASSSSTTAAAPSELASSLTTLLASPEAVTPTAALGVLAGFAECFLVKGGGGGANGTATAAPSSSQQQRQQRQQPRTPAPTPEECGLYVRAASVHIDALIDGARSTVDGRHIVEAVKAIGVAATKCQTRSEINQSGIVPALAKLVLSCCTDSASSQTAASAAKSAGNGMSSPGASDAAPSINALTPYHPEFLQCCLLASQYSYARSFLRSHPVHTVKSPMPGCVPPVTSEQYLRYHYYAGLVGIGCNDLNDAVHAFQVCLTVPSQVISAVSIAARKKMVLCRCLLLEDEELNDEFELRLGNGVRKTATFSSRGGTGGGSSLPSSSSSSLEARILEVPAAASPCVSRYISNASARVEGGGERRAAAPAGETAATSSSSPPGDRVDRGGGGSASAEATTAGGELVGGGGGSGSGDTSSSISGRPTRKQRHDSRGGAYAKNYYQLGKYHDLVATYASGNSRRYASLLDEMDGLLRYDGNFGLAKRLESHFLRRSVRKLARVYSVVSLDRIATELGLTGGAEEAEGVLTAMVARDAGRDAERSSSLRFPFRARIDQKSGMVSFPMDDGDDDLDGGGSNFDENERRYQDELTHRMESCVKLAERVRSLDVSISTSSKYQQIVMRDLWSKGGDQGGDGGPRGVAELDRASASMDPFD